MTGLVDGDGTALLLGDDLGAFFQSADDAVDGIHEVLTLHGLFLATGCDEGGLVADVGDVGTREARRLLGKKLAVNVTLSIFIITQFQPFHVDFEDSLALLDIRQLHIYLAVESSCTQQRFVQHIGSVGGSQHYHVCSAAETVHLGEELVERVLALVVGVAHPAVPSRTTNRVNFIDEYNARGFLLRLLKQVTHTRSTHADEHLDKVTARH